MNSTFYEAFTDELTKIAFAKAIWRHTGGSIGKGISTLGEFVQNPVKTTVEGWRNMSPVHRYANELAKAKEIVRTSSNAKEREAAMKTIKSITEKTHLQQGYTPQAGVKGAFERASRGGWTGEGKYTKYLPVGQKGLTTAFTVPTAVNYARGKTTHEEGLGDIGLSGGIVAASRAPFLGSLVAMEGLRRGAGFVGKQIDKVRQ